jgi:hypothetical protein
MSTTAANSQMPLGCLPAGFVRLGFFRTSQSALDLVDQIVEGERDVTVGFGEVGFDDMWSRSLFVRAFPSQEMLSIHQRTSDLLGISGPLYAPFLSLMYGEYMRQEKSTALDDARLHLPSSARIEAVSLWHTDPIGVAMWKRLRRVPIPSSNTVRSHHAKATLAEYSA